jgi:hypothetical protein
MTSNKRWGYRYIPQKITNDAVVVTGGDVTMPQPDRSDYPSFDPEEPVGKVCLGKTYFAASTAHCPLRQTADGGTDAPTLAQCEISALVHVE